VRSARGLFTDLTDRTWFGDAVDDALRGKRARREAARFLLRREAIERELVQRLTAGTWRPSPLRALMLRD